MLNVDEAWAISGCFSDIEAVREKLTGHVLAKHRSKESAKDWPAVQGGGGAHTYFRSGAARRAADPKPDADARKAARTMSDDDILALILDTIQQPDQIWETAITPQEDPNTTARALFFKDFGQPVGRDLAMGKVAPTANGPRPNEVSGVSVVIARVFGTMIVGYGEPVLTYVHQPPSLIQTPPTYQETPSGTLMVPGKAEWTPPQVIPTWVSPPILQSYVTLAIVAAFPARFPNGIVRLYP